MTVKQAGVMNGVVEAGDRIAYATRTGSGQYMSIATVLEVTEVAEPYSWQDDEKIPALRVEVTQSTDYYTVPRRTTLTVLRRVVKL